ncbi:hypothetical protein BCG9842_0064 (plasmid) [Bacillus cereus G9842]|uniref:Uncharacterized protein n=1 Tax=Bacillus cereus (strain G9842) TaxID=405531 RepID=B7IZ87_BACC2|nr:hypothetical protein BCG9842_0064 [Bacillus cereus G9842]
MFTDSVFSFISYTKKQTKRKSECYNYNIIQIKYTKKEMLRLLA